MTPWSKWKPGRVPGSRAYVRSYQDTQGKTHYQYRYFKDPEKKVYTSAREVTRRKREIIRQQRSAAGAGDVTAENIKYLEKVVIPSYKERGIAIEGITVYPQDDPDAYQKLQEHRHRMDTAYIKIRTGEPKEYIDAKALAEEAKYKEFHAVEDVLSTKKPEEEYKPTYLEIAEKETGAELGLTYATVQPKLVEATRVKQQQEYEEIERTAAGITELMHSDDPLDVWASMGHWISTGFLSWEDFLGIPSGLAAIRGDKEQATWIKAQAHVGLEHAKKTGTFWEKVYTGPMASMGIVYAGASGIGAGIGALKAVSHVAGSMAEMELISQGIADIANPLLKGNLDDFYGKALTAAMVLPIAITGYKTGYHWGYGKVEAYLYKIQHYDPGTAEWLRFEKAIKIGETLKGVKSHKRTPLDFAKDIERMDAKTAEFFLSSYKTHGGVIGGSAASYTQVVGARTPRDIDWFLQKWFGSTKALEAQAKAGLPWGLRKIQIKGKWKHRIDIHGKEMYAPGKYARFGFASESPTKIGGIKYYTAWEQLFRKGLVSITEEFKHRWFKDIPDFITHTKSLISTLELKGYNPFAQWKASKATGLLADFLNPKLSTSYGKGSLGIFASFLKTYAKPIQPKTVVDPVTGLASYYYPSSVYPSSIAALAISTKLPYPETKGIYPKAVVKQVENYLKQDYKTPLKIQAQVVPYLTGKKKQPQIYGGKREQYYLLKKQELPIPQAIEPPYKPSSKKYPALTPYPPGYKELYDPYKPGPPKKETKALPTDDVLFDFSMETVYDVFIKNRTYFKGKKRVPAKKWRKLNRFPLSEDDAISLGMNRVDNTGRATFKMIPTTGKAKKLKQKLTPWINLLHEYDVKGDGLYVEKAMYRIDSPGEIYDISRLGWSSRKNKKKRKDVDIERVNKLVQKEINRKFSLFKV